MLMHFEQLCINFLLGVVCSCVSSHRPMRKQSQNALHIIWIPRD